MVSTTTQMPKKSTGPTGTVRLRADLAHKVQVICLADDISAAELLDPVVRPFIEQRHKAALKKLNKEVDNGNGKH